MRPRISIVFIFITLALFQWAMGRHGQYDEEARQTERIERDAKKAGLASDTHPVKRFAGGVKQTTVDSATGLISETADSTRSDAPLVGTIEGARRGTEKVLDSTVKGAVKVATLGYGEVDHYEVEEPEAGSDQPTKIKISIPGT